MEKFSRALTLQTQHYGQDHFLLGATYYNIAGVLHYQGKLEEAIEFYTRALKIRSKHYGQEHL
jgi:tetratricopeptide (TPR) repeat protein